MFSPTSFKVVSFNPISFKGLGDAPPLAPADWIIRQRRRRRG